MKTDSGGPSGETPENGWAQTEDQAYRPRLLAQPVTPPNQHGAMNDDTSQATPPKALRQIRALLAKAENTPFEADAVAFTAKAQELMARYAIDRAIVERREGSGEDSISHIEIEAPYPPE